MDAFSLFQGMLGLIGTMWSTNMQINSQQQLMNQQQDNNLALMAQQNEYNVQGANAANQMQTENYLRFGSPQGQVRQLKQAGLSPGLLYSGGTAGGGGGGGFMSSVSAPSAGLGQVINPLGGINDIMNLFNSMADVDLKGAQKKNQDAQTQETHANIDKIIEETKKISGEIKNNEVLNRQLELNNMLLEFETKFQEASWEDRVATVHESLESIKAHTAETLEQIYGMQIDNKNKQELINSTLRLQEAQIANYNKDTVLKTCQAEVERVKKSLVAAQTKLAGAQQQVAEAQAKNIGEDTNKKLAEIDKLQKEANDIEFRLESYRTIGYNATNSHGTDKIIGAIADLVVKVAKWFE